MQKEIIFSSLFLLISITITTFFVVVLIESLINLVDLIEISLILS